jgi:aspartate racemase
VEKMKTLGMIGGMSWESTIEYYRIINEMIKERLGGWNSAKLLLYSVNFEEILPLQYEEKWDEIADVMIDISKKLEVAGSSAILICSNTMHKIAGEVEAHLNIPLIHVVDETARAIKLNTMKKIGLLGTKFTMEGGFYVERLTEKHGIQVLLPDQEERDYIHSAIYTELAQGQLKSSTKEGFIQIIDQLSLQGAEGIILGCTEIPLLIKEKDVKISLFDTLRIHLKAAVEFLIN